jgi:glutamate racemase
MVREYTQPLRDADVDTVILGCTHYPMVAKLIRRQVPDATLISSGEEIAREIADTLQRQGMLASRDRQGGYAFACSGDPAAFRTIGSRFLQMPFGEVQQVDPDVADGA